MTLTKPTVDRPTGDAPTALQIVDLSVGEGEEAKPGHTVLVHYVGVAFSNGKEFDSSWNRNAPFDFRLGAGEVIQGWDLGVAGMRVGGRRQLTIPSRSRVRPAGRRRGHPAGRAPRLRGGPARRPLSPPVHRSLGSSSSSSQPWTLGPYSASASPDALASERSQDRARLILVTWTAASTSATRLARSATSDHGSR